MAKLTAPGSLDFSNSQENWNDWIKRFQRYRQASGLNEKSAQRQVDTMVYVMGEEAEKVYAQLEIETPTAEQVAANGDELYDRTVAAFKNYFNPTSNTLHYQILLSGCEQRREQTNEEFIRELYELASKCGLEKEQEKNMIKMRLLAGMKDKALSRELQLDDKVSVETIKTKMRAKETILHNQRKEIDGERAGVVAAVVNHGATNQYVRTRTTQKSLGRGANKGEPTKGDGDTSGPVRSGGESVRSGGEWVRNCKYCGGTHAKRRCPAYSKRCNNCKQFNHFARVCTYAVRNAHSLDFTVADNNVPDVHVDQFESDEFLYLNNLSVSDISDSDKVDTKWLIDVKMGDRNFQAKVDTGAEISVMSKTTAMSLGITRIRKCNTTVTAYDDKPIPIIGKTSLDVAVTCAGDLRTCTELFYIVNQNSHTLLGMPAIRALQLIPAIDQVSSNPSSRHSTTDEILEMYSHVFDGLGKYHTPVSLQLKEGAKPQATSPRLVPEKVRDKLKAELDRLVSEQIIVRDTEPSEWLSPPIIVNKPDGSIRLCLDPQYLNTQLVRTRCAISTPTEIFSRISGSKIFSCLDGKQGFHQLELDQSSSKLTGFLTPFGKYRYLRLPMGVSTAPELFHQIMIDLVHDIPGVECYIDDLIIHGETIHEHNARLSAVLERFSSAGITLNRAKSVIAKTTVIFLGHELSNEGIRPHPDKVDAITEMTEPQDKHATQSFLGFVGYLAKFLPGLSEMAVPLREVCKQGVQFMWQKPQQEAFEKIKQAVVNAPTLALYDPKADVVVTADSSAHSLGAALMQGGRPVEFAAKSLTSTQQNYSQIEKELLATLFAVKRFKYYLWGRDTICVETDHRPLLGLFNKPISTLSPRLAQMRLELLSYPVRLDLKYKPGKDMIIADVLSRTCAAGTDEHDDLGADPLLQVCQLIMRSDEAMGRFQKATACDEQLPVVLRYIREGWPTSRKSCASRALPYFNLSSALSEVDGVVMYGSRVVVPAALRGEVMNKLHTAHQGVTKTLQRAQNSVFWPGLRKRVEEKCMSCDVCLRAEGETLKEPLIPVTVPHHPFEVVGVDLFMIEGENFLMIVDYLTKWPVVKPLKQATSCRSVITALMSTFSEFGTPRQLISDNASQFTCMEFREFCARQQIVHRTSSPLHPAGNGQVERTIGTVKAMMVKCRQQGSSWEEGLLAIRNTPVASGLLSPAQYIQGRLLRETIPVSDDKLEVKGYDLERYREQLGSIKSKDKFYHDNHSGSEKSSLVGGQPCYFKTAKGSWLEGKVERLVGDRSYVVSRANGSEYRRNRKDIKVSCKPISQNEIEEEQLMTERVNSNSDDHSQNSGNDEENGQAPPGSPVPLTANSDSGNESSTHMSRPRRESRLPAKYKDYVVYFK